jgi:hypothetical protein
VWGTGFLVWAIMCATFDNFLRPVLIKRGADLPLLLIFSGVIGGLIAFPASSSLFIGPVVLAVAYTFLVEWVRRGRTLRRPGRERPTVIRGMSLAVVLLAASLSFAADEAPDLDVVRLAEGVRRSADDAAADIPSRTRQRRCTTASRRRRTA